MQIASILILIPILILVIYQDFKYRLIDWWLLPILFIAFAIGLIEQPIKESITNIAINWAFLLAQFLLLTLYFSAKEKSWVNIADMYIGWGDLWFILIMAVAFSPVHFILVFISGLVFSLLLYLVLKTINKIQFQTIPLAGTFSIYLIIVELTAYLSSYSLHNDNIIIQKLSTLYV